jgi:hypothetical protein
MASYDAANTAFRHGARPSLEEDADGCEAGEGQQDELAPEADADAHGPVEPLLELRQVNLRRLPRRARRGGDGEAGTEQG